MQFFHVFEYNLPCRCGSGPWMVCEVRDAGLCACHYEAVLVCPTPLQTLVVWGRRRSGPGLVG